MDIIDQTGLFSAYIEDLRNFVIHDLLNDITSLSSLKRIIIVHIDKDWDGSWQGKWENSEIKCIIKLNAYYLESSMSLGEKIDSLKVVLSHEFGHHWTLSNIMRNNDSFEYSTHRLPERYYDLRGLDSEIFTPNYDGRPGEWHRCDKEVIAEDYKYHFAPDLYGRPHRIVAEAEVHDITLNDPTEFVEQYIREINQP